MITTITGIKSTTVLPSGRGPTAPVGSIQVPLNFLEDDYYKFYTWRSMNKPSVTVMRPLLVPEFHMQLSVSPISRHLQLTQLAHKNQIFRTSSFL